MNIHIVQGCALCLGCGPVGPYGRPAQTSPPLSCSKSTFQGVLFPSSPPAPALFSLLERTGAPLTVPQHKLRLRQPQSCCAPGAASFPFSTRPRLPSLWALSEHFDSWLLPSLLLAAPPRVTGRPLASRLRSVALSRSPPPRPSLTPPGARQLPLLLLSLSRSSCSCFSSSLLLLLLLILLSPPPLPRLLAASSAPRGFRGPAAMADIKTGIFAKNVQKRLNRAQEKVRSRPRSRWWGRGGLGPGLGSPGGRAGVAGTPCPLLSYCSKAVPRVAGTRPGGGSAGDAHNLFLEARGLPGSRVSLAPGAAAALSTLLGGHQARAAAGAAGRWRLPERSASPSRRRLPAHPQASGGRAAVLALEKFPGCLRAAETSNLAQKLLPPISAWVKRADCRNLTGFNTVLWSESWSSKPRSRYTLYFFSCFISFFEGSLCMCFRFDASVLLWKVKDNYDLNLIVL